MPIPKYSNSLWWPLGIYERSAYLNHPDGGMGPNEAFAAARPGPFVILPRGGAKLVMGITLYDYDRPSWWLHPLVHVGATSVPETDGTTITLSTRNGSCADIFGNRLLDFYMTYVSGSHLPLVPKGNVVPEGGGHGAVTSLSLRYEPYTDQSREELPSIGAGIPFVRSDVLGTYYPPLPLVRPMTSTMGHIASLPLGIKTPAGQWNRNIVISAYASEQGIQSWLLFNNLL